MMTMQSPQYEEMRVDVDCGDDDDEGVCFPNMTVQCLKNGFGIVYRMRRNSRNRALRNDNNQRSSSARFL